MNRTRNLNRWLIAAVAVSSLTLAVTTAAQADPGWRHGRHGYRYGYAGPGRVVVMHDGGAAPVLAGLIGGFVLGAALHPQPVVVERYSAPPPCPVQRVVYDTPRYRYDDDRYDRSWNSLDECREAALSPWGPRVVRVIDVRDGDCVRTLYWKHDHFISDDDRYDDDDGN